MEREHDNVDRTLEAQARLRGLLHEHEQSGEPDTPFFLGIREALADLDDLAESGESSAA